MDAPIAPAAAKPASPPHIEIVMSPLELRQLVPRLLRLGVLLSTTGAAAASLAASGKAGSALDRRSSSMRDAPRRAREPPATSGQLNGDTRFALPPFPAGSDIRRVAPPRRVSVDRISARPRVAATGSGQAVKRPPAVKRPLSASVIEESLRIVPALLFDDDDAGDSPPAPKQAGAAPARDGGSGHISPLAHAGVRPAIAKGIGHARPRAGASAHLNEVGRSIGPGLAHDVAAHDVTGWGDAADGAVEDTPADLAYGFRALASGASTLSATTAHHVASLTPSGGSVGVGGGDADGAIDNDPDDGMHP